MVKNNLQKYILLLIILLFSIPGFASPQLILFTDKSESTLGRPIKVELYGISLQSKITDVKLTHLNENFGIVTDYVINNTSDKRWPKQSIQILKLKIYPRHTGTLLIPSLSTKKARSKIKKIHITKGNTEIPIINISSNQFYERQQIIVHVTVKSNDSTSRLSIKKDQQIKGFESSPLDFQRTTIKSVQGQKKIYHLKVGWAITALKSGQLKLELPPVEYSVSGVSRKQFYFPVKNVSIKSLPSYLPPTIPVGKISIQSKLTHAGLLTSDSLSYWNIKLSGNINHVHSLPPILRQIKSNNNIKFLPVNSKRSVKTSSNHLISTVNYSIPFKPLGSGHFSLPKIRIQYFNPENGTIKMMTYQSKEFFALNNFWKVVFVILLVLIFIFTFKIIYIKLQRIRFSKLKRKQAICLLQKADNLDYIRESLRLLAEAEYWPKNITIRKWSEYWREKYQVNNNFVNLINTLSSCLYSPKENYTSNELSLQLLELVNNRKRLSIF